MKTPDYERLDEEKNNISRELKPLSLRIHRAISWGRQAEQLSDNLDVRFMFLWIGFNSLYSREPNAAIAEGQNAKETIKEIREYLDVLVPLNSDLIHKVFWEGDAFCAGLLLMKDPYLFQFFWKVKTDPAKQNKWFAEWESNKRKFCQAKSFDDTQKEKEIPNILSFTIFRRLCVLRNQVMHGSATHKSSKNRNALHRGVIVMERFLPICIDLMLKNPSEDWGKPLYPPDDKKPI